MSVTKHRIFKIGISDNDKFDLDTKTEELINDFLAEPNNVYVNHSITVLTDGKREHSSYRTVSKLLIVSLVYKDLKDSSLNLRNTGKKIQEVVRKEIELGENIKKTKEEPSFEKKLKHLLIHPQPKKSELIIHLAEYRAEERFRDITKEISELVASNQLLITASNDIWGDPYPNKPKTLIIEYSINAERKRVEIKEGTSRKLK